MKLNLGTPLSRSEMKNVVGGKLPAGQATCAFFGSCISYSGANTGPYDPDNTALANNYQTSGDEWCEAHDCCTKADCPGAV